MKISFSDRLTQARKLRGFTQLELSRVSGISQSAIASYESGARKSSRSTRKLARALNVEVEWLETGHGPMQASDGYPTGGACATPALMDAAAGGKLHAGARYWPFASITPARYDGLATRDKRRLEQMMKIFIDSCYLDSCR